MKIARKRWDTCAIDKIGYRLLNVQRQRISHRNTQSSLDGAATPVDAKQLLACCNHKRPCSSLNFLTRVSMSSFCDLPVGIGSETKNNVPLSVQFALSLKSMSIILKSGQCDFVSHRIASMLLTIPSFVACANFERQPFWFRRADQASWAGIIRRPRV